MTFDWLFEVLKTHPSLIPVTTFVVALGEAIVFTSPLVPATVLVIGLGALQQAAGGSFAAIAIAAIAGTFLGDVASYAIGRRYRGSIGTWWPLRNNPGWLPAAIEFMRNWGWAGLIGSKFLGPVRWFGPAICGVLVMPVAPFLLVTILASVIWALVVLGPPYYGTHVLFGG
ncbi:MAG TPA: VTT domain-containing protein [Hyphomicrobiaceae bacterium]|nr:VTT domain-containing protein [Hyphomicrobiaceae bacterium]